MATVSMATDRRSTAEEEISRQRWRRRPTVFTFKDLVVAAKVVSMTTVDKLPWQPIVLAATRRRVMRGACRLRALVRPLPNAWIRHCLPCPEKPMTSRGAPEVASSTTQAISVTKSTNYFSETSKFAAENGSRFVVLIHSLEAPLSMCFRIDCNNAFSHTI